MHDQLKDLVLSFFKVPHQPDPPAGSKASIQIFRASRNFYRLKLLQWALAQGAAFLGILAMLIGGVTLHLKAEVSLLLRIGEVIGFVALITQIPFTYFLIRLDYEMRWYIVTDRSLRIREGVQQVREMTMTFANIQQIVVRQGPLQRLLGIADVQVQTAGGGGGGGSDEHGQKFAGESMHVGYFRGVENAEEIRDLMIERLRRWRDAGLGDPDDIVHHSVKTDVVRNPAYGDLIGAARELVEEARSLRKIWPGMTK